MHNSYPNHSFAVYPGQTLREKLSEMNMGIKELSLRTDIPETTILAVLKEDVSISSDMAIAFEKVTKIPTHFWLNMQRNYDEYTDGNW